MKATKLFLALVLALCLLAAAAIAEEADVFTAPVDAVIEETETDLWTEDIAKDVAAAEAMAKDGVSIAATFPDAAFRDFIKENFDTDKDGALSDEEIAAVKEISVYNQGVASLEGVKVFTSLKTLYCGSNPITVLDVSGMTALQTLGCNQCQLTTLDITGCTALTNCSCYRNQLPTIDLTGCAALTDLSCWRNPLTSLDVSGCPVLQKLDCGTSNLTELNVRMCTALTDLTCGGGPLKNLDVRGCTALKWLICTNAQLTSLDVSGCVNLTKLEVTTNQLTSLDLSGLDDLFHLYCAGNQLTSLDIRGKANLKLVDCHMNPFTELDLSGCSNWMINCAAATPTLYDDGTDHEYFKHTAGTGEQLIIDRDVKTVFDGNVIYDPPLITRRCTIAEIPDRKIGPFGYWPDIDITCDGESLKLNTDYKCKYENCYNVGTGHVKVWGIGRFTGATEFSFRILQCPIADAEIEDIPDQTWTGSAIEPEIKVVHEADDDSRTLVEGTHYTVAYKNNVDAGTATVTVTGIGNYKGTAKATFKIVRGGAPTVEPTPTTEPTPTSEPVKISQCKIGTIKNKTYTGKAIKPAPVVKYNGEKLKKGTDYTVSYKNNTKIGLATVTVKGKGNFTGSKKVTFKIIPKAVALSKLTAGKGKLTVKWKKGAGGAGYQLQYATKKDFSNKKTVTIAKTATVSKTIKSLKSGKKYYVRIRAYKKVGGKAYVSAWSKVKSAKVK